MSGTTLYVVDFGEQISAVRQLIRRSSGALRCCNDADIVAPVVICDNLAENEVELLNRLFTDIGAKVLCVDEKTQEFSSDEMAPYSLVMTGVGQNPAGVSRLIGTWTGENITGEKISEVLPYSICSSPDPEAFAVRAQLLRQAGAFVWICKMRDPRTTFKVVVEQGDAGLDGAQLVFLRNFATKSNSVTERDFLASYTICSGLLKSEALSAVDLLKKAGINAFCLNSMGEVQTE